MSRRGRRAIVDTGFALVGALGLVVMLGWLLHSPALIQLHPAFSPMQFNAALAFVLAAASGLAGSRAQPRAAAALAIGVLLLGGLTVLQYLASIDLGIDQLFITPFTTIRTTHPGRMAPNAALAFMLCGTALALRPGRDRASALACPLLATIVACIGAAALAGYSLGLESAYGWAQHTRMALHTALAFVLLGASLVFDTWRNGSIGLGAVLPAIGGIAVATATLLLWGALEAAQSRGLEHALERQGQIAAQGLADRLQGELAALGRMRDRLALGMSVTGWQADAANYLHDIPGLQALQLQSPRRGAELLLTVGGGAPVFPPQPCPASVLSMRPLATIPAQRPPSLYRIELPLVPGRLQEGCLSALIDLRRNLADLQDSVQSHLVLELVEAGPGAADTDEFAVPFAATGLRLRARATPELRAEFQSPLPLLFLIAGLFLAATTSLSLAQLLRSRRQAEALGRAADELRAEIARRDTLQHHLQTANERLDDFAYIASHDLREPLRGLTSLAGFLLEDYGDRLDETGRQRLLALQGQARRLSGFIGDLLEYSRAGAGGRFTAVDLDALLSGVLERLRPELGALGVRLSCGGPLGTAQGDPARLRMVFEYLIDNAARFNEENDRQVSIAVRTGPPRTYTVTDNGIGIPEEHRERVFRMFTRLHHRDAYGGGSGAGLSIARKIVEAHGGRLWAEARPDGQRGSVFCFTLGDAPPATETR